MKNTEKTIGLILVATILLFSRSFLASDMLFFRLVIGISLGYALTRAAMGFAGSSNRAFRFGSTKLMRTLMYLFFISTLITTAFLYAGGEYRLWVNPINTGLLLGGLLFGLGMSVSICCASGVMTDLVTGLPRAFTTLIFFGVGVFVGFPIQRTQSWVQKSIVTSSEKTRGVFLPDLFKGDGLNGFLGAILLSGLFALIVVALSYLYEKRRKENNTFTPVQSEVEQHAPLEFDSKDFKACSSSTYDMLFVKPWSLKTGATVIAILYGLLLGVTKTGWGASTPYGHWFGRLLKLFGVSSASLESFSKVPAKVYDMPFFSHPVYVQNIGIAIGTLLCLLLAGKFMTTFKQEFKLTAKDALLFSMGGFLMGFGTRLSNGCNVGALYTPIAQFSLAGWLYLIFITSGAYIGNKLLKKYL